MNSNNGYFRLAIYIHLLVLFSISDVYSGGGSQPLAHLSRDQAQTLEMRTIQKPEFYGKFQDSRKRIDYKFHKNYEKDRQLFQDSVIEKYVRTGITSPTPTILFTAGPMGVGKSSTIRYLAEQGDMDLSSFIWSDPDQAKLELPEKEALMKSDPTNWASQLHAESIFIQEIVFFEALKLKKNIIVDRSFRGIPWHLKLFASIRKEHPAYSIEILQVVAEEKTNLTRLKSRETKTQFHVPLELVSKAFIDCPKTVESLIPYADRIRIFNNDGEFPKLIEDQKNSKPATTFD